MRVFGPWTSTLTVALVAMSCAGCADPLSIRPPGAGGDGGRLVGAGGDGGGAPVPCLSNSDCPAPTGVCDAVRGVCVECLQLGDCADRPGTVCSVAQCVCADAAQSWCAPNICADLLTSTDHCGVCERACFGACDMGACADPWEVVAPVGAPSARGRHVAVWADTVMMVWGGTTDTGVANNLNTGALYDPTTFTWKPTSLTNAPAPRQSATAIWTGTAVIVWGGRDGAVHFDSGAMYDPVANTWTPMATAAAPTPRINHTAVWTGSEMIVWGGRDAAGVQLNTGGRFDPATNSWVATEALSGPVHTRERHSAVWAGTEMWIYGGVGDAPPFMLGNSYWPTGPIPGGLRYSPSNGTWDVMPAMGQPTMRDRHTAVFDGLQMIVFGGFDGTDDNNTSFILDGGATVWTGTSGVAPAPRREHSAVWLPDATPPVMIVWGGRSSAGGVLNTGGVYVSTGNQWIEATPTALSPRVEHTAVSTGNTMIVWGGFDNNDGALGDGGIYIP